MSKKIKKNENKTSHTNSNTWFSQRPKTQNRLTREELVKMRKEGLLPEPPKFEDLF